MARGHINVDEEASLALGRWPREAPRKAKKGGSPPRGEHMGSRKAACWTPSATTRHEWRTDARRKCAWILARPGPGRGPEGLVSASPTGARARVCARTGAGTGVRAGQMPLCHEPTSLAVSAAASWGQVTPGAGLPSPPRGLGQPSPGSRGRARGARRDAAPGRPRGPAAGVRRDSPRACARFAASRETLGPDPSRLLIWKGYHPPLRMGEVPEFLGPGFSVTIVPVLKNTNRV